MVVLCATFFTVSPLLAAEARAEPRMIVQLGRVRIFQDEVVPYLVAIENATSASPLKLEGFEKFEVYPRGRGFNTEIINGRQTGFRISVK